MSSTYRITHYKLIDSKIKLFKESDSYLVSLIPVPVTKARRFFHACTLTASDEFGAGLNPLHDHAYSYGYDDFASLPRQRPMEPTSSSSSSSSSTTTSSTSSSERSGSAEGDGSQHHQGEDSSSTFEYSFSKEETDKRNLFNLQV